MSKKGYVIDLYEKEEKAGGLLTYAIPDFRVKKEIVEYTINNIIEENKINLKTKKELGNNISIKDLKKEYQAIFIAIGSYISLEYKLTDVKINQIYKSVDFLKKYAMNEKQDNLGNVVVIGGGNVAIDSARVAKRQGAKEVSIIYRKDEMSMPARKIEIEEAIKDGIKIIYNTKVIKANDINRCKINSIECIKTKLENDEYVEIENSNFIKKADTIIFAIGLNSDSNLFKKEKIKFDNNNLIIIDENNMTNIKGVFAGGDITTKKGTICKAISIGKQAAESIDRLIKLNKI